MKKVKDIMFKGKDNPVVTPRTCFREALELLNSDRLGAVNVVKDSKLVGIITDGDVRRLILKTQEPLAEVFMKNAEEVMTVDPKAISPDLSLDDCLKILEKYKLWVIPVVDKSKKLLGLVHMQFLLKAMMVDK